MVMVGNGKLRCFGECSVASQSVREPLAASPKGNKKLARQASMIRWEDLLPLLTDLEKDRAFAVSAVLIVRVEFLHAELSRFQRGVELRHLRRMPHSFLRE